MINTTLFEPRNFIVIGLMSMAFTLLISKVFSIMNNKEGE